MSATTLFSESIPQDYDTHLGPFLFEFYAADLARRLRIDGPGSILETACGTGIATAFLRRSLCEDVSIVATDVSEGMLDIARRERGRLSRVRFQQADAQDLPFEDASFDAVVNQFGLMFLPDKLQAMREARRVLRPGGRLALNVWGDLPSNPYVQVTQDAIATFFEEDPPQFLYLPWSYHDPVEITALVEAAGFDDVACHEVSCMAERPTVRHVATGLVRGNPTIRDVEDRANGTVDEVIDAVADALGDAFGRAPFRAPLQAIVVTARRSGRSS